jgi:hypothetical protein
MSPEMLTLVAEVLAYDIALETCDLRSSMVETDEDPLAICLLSVAAGLSLKERSCTRLENDIVQVDIGNLRWWVVVFDF